MIGMNCRIYSNDYGFYIYNMEFLPSHSCVCRLVALCLVIIMHMYMTKTTATATTTTTMMMMMMMMMMICVHTLYSLFPQLPPVMAEPYPIAKQQPTVSAHHQHRCYVSFLSSVDSWALINHAVI